MKKTGTYSFRRLLWLFCILFFFSFIVFSQQEKVTQLELQPIKEYYSKAISLEKFDRKIGHEVSNSDALLIAGYEAAQMIRNSIKTKIDSIIIIVKKENCSLSDSLFSFILIKEIWRPELDCGKYVKYKEHGYCSLEVHMEQRPINELYGVLDRNEVYYYLIK